MPKQITNPGCNWGVGDAVVQTPEGEKQVRMVVFTDASGDEYLFPIPLEDAIALGGVLMSDDPMEATRKLNEREEAKEKLLGGMDRVPTEAELQAAARLQKGMR